MSSKHLYQKKSILTCSIVLSNVLVLECDPSRDITYSNRPSWIISRAQEQGVIRGPIGKSIDTSSDVYVLLCEKNELVLVGFPGDLQQMRVTHTQNGGSVLIESDRNRIASAWTGRRKPFGTPRYWKSIVPGVESRQSRSKAPR